MRRYNANNLKDYKKKVEHYLNSHKDELAIYKLRNNKKITKQDVETLEDILFSQLGNEADYEKEFGKTPVTQLVRKLVGLDRNAANEAFSEFLNNDSFNSKQIHFVKLIVDYVVKNGHNINLYNLLLIEHYALDFYNMMKSSYKPS